MDKETETTMQIRIMALQIYNPKNGESNGKENGQGNGNCMLESTGKFDPLLLV